ncbi:hypothetical protein [Scytonema sp. PRP1]|uniref:hypothetical protein n=1 Tax=Scytonema sp. PRP1 TaxID=3120513 RepID=UPI002FCED7C3
MRDFHKSNRTAIYSSPDFSRLTGFARKRKQKPPVDETPIAKKKRLVAARKAARQRPFLQKATVASDSKT